MKKKRTETDEQKAAKRRAKRRKLALVVGLGKLRRKRAAARRTA